jgi:hypothetical protein
MRFECLVCLLLASLTFGQAAQPATPAAAGAKAEKVASATVGEVPEVEVGPNDPVITVNGFCGDPAQQGSGCKTVVTRAQFENLTEALQPGMSLSLKLNVANAYACNLRMAAAAEKRGLDKTPAFDEEMRYARMQLLSQDLTHALQADANNIADSDLEDYYKKNQSSYEEATVARIFVPRAKQSTSTQTGATQQTEAQTKADEDAMTKIAADLRARAANGEDPDKLQTEAYTEAGIPRTTLNTKMEKVRRAALPPQHETVLDLKPGEVSEVFSDPAGAHFIYKMISKQTLMLEDVKTEIRSAISSQRYRDSMKSFQGDVVFSDAYFNPSRRLAAPPQGNRKGKRKKAPAQHDENHE